MSGYAKVFASLFDGSLRGKSDEILVFVNILTHTSSHGRSDIHFKKISDETGLPLKRVKAAIQKLESPDPESRSPDEEGRRMVRIDPHREWGWKIVNHAKYRLLAGGDESYREKTRERVNRFRDKVTLRNVSVGTVTLPHGSVSVPEGEGVGEGTPINGKTVEIPYADILTFKECVGGFFGRKPEDPWNNDEEHLMLDILKRPHYRAEVNQIFLYWKKKDEYRVQSLPRLLEKWPAVVDRARNFKEKSCL